MIIKYSLNETVLSLGDNDGAETAVQVQDRLVKMVEVDYAEHWTSATEAEVRAVFEEAHTRAAEDAAKENGWAAAAESDEYGFTIEVSTTCR